MRRATARSSGWFERALLSLVWPPAACAAATSAPQLGSTVLGAASASAMIGLWLGAVTAPVGGDFWSGVIAIAKQGGIVGGLLFLPLCCAFVTISANVLEHTRGGGDVVAARIRAWYLTAIAGVLPAATWAVCRFAALFNPKSGASDVPLVQCAEVATYALSPPFVCLFLLIAGRANARGVSALLPQLRYCGKCGYDLEGLHAGICPECGSDVTTPSDATRAVHGAP